MKKSFFIFILLAVIGLASSVGAQSVDFATTKSVFDIELVPGSPHKESLVIMNNSRDVALPVEVNLSLWNLKEDSDDIEFVTAEAQLNATKWFSVNTGGRMRTLNGYTLLVEPRGDRDLKFVIAPPADAPAGTYLVSMRLTAAPVFNNEGVQTVPELQILFFLKVRPLTLDFDTTGDYLASVLSLTPAGGGGGSGGGINVAEAGVLDKIAQALIVRIRNDGRYYFKADGIVEIKNMFNRVVGTFSVPPRYLIPGRARTFSVPVFASPEGGFVKNILYAVKEYTYLGPYTATLILNYPGTGEVAGSAVFASQSVKFWVVPWKFWLLFSVAVYGVYMAFVRYRKRIIKAGRALLKRA